MASGPSKQSDDMSHLSPHDCGGIGITSAPIGTTYWITGLPESGKTTTARLLCARLKSAGSRAILIDGDRMREILGGTFGYGRAERETLSGIYGRWCQELNLQGTDAVRDRLHARGCATVESPKPRQVSRDLSPGPLLCSAPARPEDTICQRHEGPHQRHSGSRSAIRGALRTRHRHRQRRRGEPRANRRTALRHVGPQRVTDMRHGDFTTLAANYVYRPVTLP
jgi:Adenylylsulphate kinase